MLTKALLCGCVFGWLAAFIVMLDPERSRVLDFLAQVPACGEGEFQCHNLNPSAHASTGRFFAMLAMN